MFLNHVAQTSPEPMALEIESAKGVWMYGKDGKKYLDLISGISVSNTGHRHDQVLKAIHSQLDKYLYLMVYGELVQGPQVELAKAITDLLPSSLSSVYFVNSGAEAVEGALKLAKRYTGRAELISFENSYHGSTAGALSIMGSEYFKSAFRPLVPGSRIIRYNWFEDISKITNETAAVIIEPVQGEAGAIIPVEGYLKAISDRCKETGTLLIFDEIQTGMGRTGTLFAFEQSGVIPDILLLAKGFGGGLPLGAFISSKEIMASLTLDPVLGHITTFGGHPLSCAAAKANLDVIVNDKLWERGLSSEKFIRAKLKHPKIVSLKGKALLLAMELSSEEECRTIIRSCLDKGLLTDWFLFAANCLRIAPPLIITEEELDHACGIILECLNELS